MEYVGIIQKKWNMWKVNLTVFAHNEAALKFYKKIGYTIDKNYEKEDDADSFIFSNPYDGIYVGDIKIVADELDTIESTEELKLVKLL
jgi:RimJ/RimL family protein N-acetyltransferase